MMLFHLVKKDFLIIKNYVLLMFVVCTFIPPFMIWRVPEYAGPMGFVLSVIFSVFMLLQYVSVKDHQYPKASALLCAAPYPRRLLVAARYIFFLVIYAVCCVIFGIETFIFSELGGFHFEMPSLLFFALAVFLGIYLPLQYRLGYEKTRFVFMVVIMASPFLMPLFLKLREGTGMSLPGTLPPALLYGGIVLAGLAILAVSACVSVSIYRRADLA